jgi:T5SS/PEP-CTERM-associated repeat protein
MKRREFIAGLGSAVAWPLAARAQQPERIRRIGVLIPDDENDPLAKARISAFAQAFADCWTDGRNVRIDLRLTGVDINRIRAFARELVGLQPDIIVTAGTPATAALQRETRTIPIVFTNVSDPVASGIVGRLDRPSGNITGFAVLEATLGGKWLVVGGTGSSLTVTNYDNNSSTPAGLTNELVIQSGGAVTVQNSIGIGRQVGDKSTIAVGGSGATFTYNGSGNFIIGNAGTGTVSVANGGTATVHANTLIGSQGSLTINGNGNTASTSPTMAIPRSGYHRFPLNASSRSRRIASERDPLHSRFAHASILSMRCWGRRAPTNGPTDGLPAPGRRFLILFIVIDLRMIPFIIISEPGKCLEHLPGSNPQHGVTHVTGYQQGKRESLHKTREGPHRSCQGPFCPSAPPHYRRRRPSRHRDPRGSSADGQSPRIPLPRRCPDGHR